MNAPSEWNHNPDETPTDQPPQQWVTPPGEPAGASPASAEAGQFAPAGPAQPGQPAQGQPSVPPTGSWYGEQPFGQPHGQPQPGVPHAGPPDPSGPSSGPWYGTQPYGQPQPGQAPFAQPHGAAPHAQPPGAPGPTWYSQPRFDAPPYGGPSGGRRWLRPVLLVLGGLVAVGVVIVAVRVVLTVTGGGDTSDTSSPEAVTKAFWQAAKEQDADAARKVVCDERRGQIRGTAGFTDPQETLLSISVGDATTSDGETIVPTTLRLTEDGQTTQVELNTVVVKEHGEYLVCDFTVAGLDSGGLPGEGG